MQVLSHELCLVTTSSGILDPKKQEAKVFQNKITLLSEEESPTRENSEYTYETFFSRGIPAAVATHCKKREMYTKKKVKKNYRNASLVCSWACVCFFLFVISLVAFAFLWVYGGVVFMKPRGSIRTRFVGKQIQTTDLQPCTVSPRATVCD